jgi:hypothetical protein
MSDGGDRTNLVSLTRDVVYESWYAKGSQMFFGKIRICTEIFAFAAWPAFTRRATREKERDHG